MQYLISTLESGLAVYYITACSYGKIKLNGYSSNEFFNDFKMILKLLNQTIQIELFTASKIVF